MSLVPTKEQILPSGSTMGLELVDAPSPLPQGRQSASIGDAKTQQMPMQEIVRRLHSLGSYYWMRLDTVDLVIIVSPADPPLKDV